MIELIRKFKNINKDDVALAGGKGSSLGEMTRYGIPVPPGFVLLSTAFKKFLDENRLNEKINSILHSVNQKERKNVEKASRKIKELISRATIPNSISSEIRRSFKDLHATFVAVRSSATAEDSASAAWAGQLETYLNTNEKNLLDNIKKCWASLFSPRAMFYRFETGQSKKKISVAVVVQKMVDSEKSGVGFSIHPVTQDENQLMIEAGFGLGEAVVSGSISPDRYIINKRELTISGIHVSTKTKELYRDHEGKNVWKNLGKNAEKQVLTHNTLLKLSKLIINIEKHYGFAVDIEWAIEKDRVYVLQSRPITTLSVPVQEYRNIMTRPQNLIECECWDEGERIKLPKKFRGLIFFDPLFIYAPRKGVAIHYNFTDSKQQFQPLIDFLEKHHSWFKKQKVEFDKNCQRIRKLINNKSTDHRTLHELIIEIWPMIAITNALGSTKHFKVSRELRKMCIIIRNESDDVLHPAINYLSMLVAHLIPHKEYIDQILYSEFATHQLPLRYELNRRKKGWFYHQGVVIKDRKKYLRENHIELISPSKFSKTSTIVTGATACKGFANGTVKVIYEISDLKKIKNDDIIVTPMTTPEMVPVLRKVSAIITDEGGVTCHAAIISRELNIPTVIGTVNATRVLKDGDRVEVDATEGIVNIIKRAK